MQWKRTVLQIIGIPLLIKVRRAHRTVDSIFT